MYNKIRYKNINKTYSCFDKHQNHVVLYTCYSLLNILFTIFLAICRITYTVYSTHTTTILLHCTTTSNTSTMNVSHYHIIVIIGNHTSYVEMVFILKNDLE